MPKTAPNFNIATRTSVITLKAPAGGGLPSTQIKKITGISIRTINRIYTQAVTHSFQPKQRPLLIQDAYVKDAPQAGRPTKQAITVVTNILKAVRVNRYSREKTYDLLAYELQQQGIQISATTV